MSKVHDVAAKTGKKISAASTAQLAEMAQILKRQRDAQKASAAPPQTGGTFEGLRALGSNVRQQLNQNTELRRQIEAAQPRSFADFNSAQELYNFRLQNTRENADGNAVSKALQADIDALDRRRKELEREQWYHTADEMERINAQYSPEDAVYSALQIADARELERLPEYASALELAYYRQLEKERQAALDKALSPYRKLSSNADYYNVVQAAMSKEQPKYQPNGLEQARAFMGGGSAGFNAASSKEFEFTLSNPALWAAQNSEELLKQDAKYAAEAGGLSTGEYLYMTDEELQIYTYLAETQGRAEADKYFDLLREDLQGRRQEHRYTSQAAWAKDHPWAASLASFGTSLLQPIGYIGNAEDYLADGEIDPNSIWNAPAQVTSAFREGATSNLYNDYNAYAQELAAKQLRGETVTQEELSRLEELEATANVFSFLSNTGYSIGDNLTTMLLGGGGTGSALLMGGEAAGATTYQALRSGKTAEQALAEGGVSALVESATERWSLGNLKALATSAGTITKGSVKSFIKELGKNMAKQGLAEASEEAVSAYAHTIYDIIVNGENSEYNQHYVSLLMQGVPADEAEALTQQEFFFTRPGESALSGGLSGMFFGGGGTVVGGFQNRMTPEQQAAASTLAGITQREQSGSSTVADTVAEKVLTGQAPSNSEIRRLQNATTTIQRAFENMTGIEVVGVDSSNLRASIAAVAKNPVLTADTATQVRQSVEQMTAPDAQNTIPPQAVPQTAQYNTLSYNAPEVSAVGAIDAARQGGAPLELASAQNTGSAADMAGDFRQRQTERRKPTGASPEVMDRLKEWINDIDDYASEDMIEEAMEYPPYLIDLLQGVTRDADGSLWDTLSDAQVNELAEYMRGVRSGEITPSSNAEDAWREMAAKRAERGSREWKNFIRRKSTSVSDYYGLSASEASELREILQKAGAVNDRETMDEIYDYIEDINYKYVFEDLAEEGIKAGNRNPSENDDIRFRAARTNRAHKPTTDIDSVIDHIESGEFSVPQMRAIASQIGYKLTGKTKSTMAEELAGAVDMAAGMNPDLSLDVPETAAPKTKQPSKTTAEEKAAPKQTKQQKAVKAAQSNVSPRANLTKVRDVNWKTANGQEVSFVEVNPISYTYGDEPLTEDYRATVHLAEAFGEDVVWAAGRGLVVDGVDFSKDGGTWGGFTTNGKIVLNAENMEEAYRWTVGHEIGHRAMDNMSLEERHQFVQDYYTLRRTWAERTGTTDQLEARINDIINERVYDTGDPDAVMMELIADDVGDFLHDEQFARYAMGENANLWQRITRAIGRVLRQIQAAFAGKHRYYRELQQLHAMALNVLNDYRNVQAQRGSSLGDRLAGTAPRVNQNSLPKNILRNVQNAKLLADMKAGRYQGREYRNVSESKWESSTVLSDRELTGATDRRAREADNYGYRKVNDNGRQVTIFVTNPNAQSLTAQKKSNVAAMRSLAAATGMRIGFGTGTKIAYNKKVGETGEAWNIIRSDGTTYINLDSPNAYTALLGQQWYDQYAAANPARARMLNRLMARANKLTGKTTTAQQFAAEQITSAALSNYIATPRAMMSAKALTMKPSEILETIASDRALLRSVAKQNPTVFRLAADAVGDLIAKHRGKADQRVQRILAQAEANLNYALAQTADENRDVEEGGKIETAKRKSVPKGVRFMSVKKDADGQTYVEVEGVNNLDERNVAQILAAIIKDKFNNLITAHGQSIRINQATNREWRESGSARKLRDANPVAYRDKLVSLNNADELIAAVKEYVGEEKTHSRNPKIAEFARGPVRFKVGSRAYLADVLIATTVFDRSALLYDLVNIEEIKITDPPLTSSGKAIADREEESVDTTIPHPADEVKFSARRDNNTVLREPTRTDPVDTYKRRDLRSKISKEVKALSAALVTPSDKKHIPSKLTSAIADFLKEFANDTSVFTAAKLAVLRDAYDRLSDTGADSDMDVSYAYDPDISETISELSDTIDGRRLAQLDMDETVKVRNIVQHFKHLVTAENKLFLEGRKRDVAALGSDIMTELRQRPAAGAKADQGTFKAFTDMLTSGNITPAYFFKRIGGTMESLFKSMRSGQNVWATNMRQAQQTYESIFKKHHADKWLNKRNDTLTFTTERGDNITLTRQQALTLYATHQREVTNQIQEAGHLSLGGFVYEDAVKTKRGEESVDTTKAHPLNANDMRRIIDWLTDEQIQFADELVGYMSGDLAKLGNETSLKLHGWEKFTESYYFPYNSAENYLYTKQAVTEDRRLKHMSFTKSTVRKANNPIVLSDFTQVWANHVQNMLMYSSLAVPLEDFNRVYNYKTSVTEDSTSRSVKEAIEKAYGKNANAYIRQLMADINGGVTPPRSEGFFNRMMSKFRKSAVFASASVVVQQPSAIGRSMALIDPKYFVASTFQRKNWEECKRWCGVALIKEMGRFDTSTGRGAADWLIAQPYKGVQKVGAFFTDGDFRDDVLSAPAAKADAYTWSAIWNACKREAVREKGLQPNSEELFKAAAERFDEVINFTQVYDSVFARSELMRSKSGLTKAMTAFMSEPTVTYNMLLDSVVNARRKDVKNKVNPARAAGAFILSATINAVLKSLVTVLREEDEDKTYIEKYLGELVENFESDTNLLSLIPYVRDLLSLVKGYSVENTAYDVPKDFIEAGGDILEWIEANITGDDTNVDIKTALLDLGDAISAGFGIPVKNIRRDVESIYNTVYSTKPLSETSKAGILDSILSKTQYYDNRKTANYGRLVDAYMSGDVDKAADIVDRLLVSGTEESSIVRGTKSVVKTEYLNGRISDEEAIKFLVDHGNADADDAYWLIQEWEYNSTKGDDDPNFSKYLRLRAALDADDKAEIHDAAVELLEHGVSVKTLKSETKKHAGSSSILYRSGLADYLNEDKEKNSDGGSGSSGGRSSGSRSGRSSAKSAATSLKRGEVNDAGAELSTIKPASSQTLRKPTTQSGGRVRTDSPSSSTVSGGTDPTIPSAGQTGIFNAGCANNENGSCRIGRASCENCPYATNK